MNLKPLAMRDALLENIWLEMAKNEQIFFVTADFGSPVLDKIRADFPKRFANVGIAEQNLINISAGLALEGFTVFAYAIAPFITMRCYEQIRVSLALLSEVRPMNVNLIGVGAGYSYVVSGPTHQCYEDITLMRALPNFRFYSPADHITASRLFRSCIDNVGPKYLRLDAQVLPVIYHDVQPNLETGFHVHKKGKKICIVATGFMLHTALLIEKYLHEQTDVNIGVIDLIDLARFDREKFIYEIKDYQGIVSMEEGFRGRGGVDSMLFELIARKRIPIRLLNIGVDGRYSFELGTREELHEQVGLGPETVNKQVQEFIKSLNN
jgi:transketolase